MTDKNKEFHEALGNSPDLNYCSCGCGQIIELYPDYAADPRLVIEVMREREDWVEFSAWLISGLNNNTSLIMELFIDLIMDKTGKLRDLGIEWMKEWEK